MVDIVSAYKHPSGLKYFMIRCNITGKNRTYRVKALLVENRRHITWMIQE